MRRHNVTSLLLFRHFVSIPLPEGYHLKNIPLLLGYYFKKYPSPFGIPLLKISLSLWERLGEGANFHLSSSFPNHPAPFLVVRVPNHPAPFLVVRKGFNPPPVPRPLQGGGSTAPPRRSFTKVCSTHQRVGIVFTQQSCDYFSGFARR